MSQHNEQFETHKLPMMPIRDVVIFPHMMTPFVVGREISVLALEKALASGRRVFLATQHDAGVDRPKAGEIYEVGTIANIVQDLKLPDGNIKVLVEGVERGITLQLDKIKGHFEATVRTMKYAPEITPEVEEITRQVRTLWDQYAKLSRAAGREVVSNLAVAVGDPGKLSDLVAQNLDLDVEEKQELLEIFDPIKRLPMTAELLAAAIEDLREHAKS